MGMGLSTTALLRMPAELQKNLFPTGKAVPTRGKHALSPQRKCAGKM